MKKLKSLLLIAGLVSFAACQNELAPEKNGNEEQTKRVVRLHATSDAPTKATLTDDYEVNKVFNAGWENGKDYITVDYTAGIYADAVWNQTEGAFLGDDLMDGEDLYAYFPKGSDCGCVYGFDGSNREQNGNLYNSNYDLMYSEVFTIEKDATDVTVKMNRATAIQYFHLEADGSAEWANKKIISAILSVTGQNAAIAAESVIMDGTGALDLDGKQTSIKLSFVEASAPTASDLKLWFNVLPGKVESMTISVVLEDGYSWEVTNNFGGQGYTFEAGKLGYVKGAPTYRQNLKAIFSVNGEETSKSYSEGDSIVFPEDPESIGDYDFVGWATTPIDESQETEPAVVNTATQVMGGENITYYAVFAIEKGATPEIVTLNAVGLSTAGYKEGNQNDSAGNTWTYYASINNQSGTLYFALNSNELNYNIGSPEFADNVKSISLKAYNGSSTADRVLYICSSNSTAQPSSGDIATVTVARSQRFTETYTADLSSASAFNQFYIYAPEALGVSEVTVSYGGITTLYTTTIVTLKSVSVSGTPTKKTYNAGEAFNPAGLVVTGTYSDDHEEEITTGINWTVPNSLSEGQTSCDVTATVDEISSLPYTVTGLTVNAAATSASYDFSANTTTIWDELLPTGYTQTENTRIYNSDSSTWKFYWYLYSGGSTKEVQFNKNGGYMITPSMSFPVKTIIITGGGTTMGASCAATIYSSADGYTSSLGSAIVNTDKKTYTFSLTSQSAGVTYKILFSGGAGHVQKVDFKNN